MTVEQVVKDAFQEAAKMTILNVWILYALMDALMIYFLLLIVVLSKLDYFPKKVTFLIFSLIALEAGDVLGPHLDKKDKILSLINCDIFYFLLERPTLLPKQYPIYWPPEETEELVKEIIKTEKPRYIILNGFYIQTPKNHPYHRLYRHICDRYRFFLDA